MDDGVRCAISLLISLIQISRYLPWPSCSNPFLFLEAWRTFCFRLCYPSRCPGSLLSQYLVQGGDLRVETKSAEMPAASHAESVCFDGERAG